MDALDDDIENFNLKDYQPMEARPRKVAKRSSGGVALLEKELTTSP